MPSPKKNVVDLFLQHQVSLSQFTEAEAQNASDRLFLFQKRILNKLSKSPSLKSRDRMIQELAGIRKVMSEAFLQAGESFTDSVFNLTLQESEWYKQVLSSITKKEVRVISIDDLGTNPVVPGNQTFRTALEKLSSASALRIHTEIIQGAAFGATNIEIAREMEGAFNLTNNQLKTLVRTGLQSQSSEVRDKYYSDNKDVVPAVYWLATLDGRTTSICATRDGLRYTTEGHKPIDHDVPWMGGPPAHFNCRSIAVPDMDGSGTRVGFDYNKESGGSAKSTIRVDKDGNSISPLSKGERAKGTSVRMGKGRTYSSGLNFESWFKDQPAWFQDQYLGAKKAQLYRKGGIPLSNFSLKTGQKLSLAELKASYPKQWAHAFGETVEQGIKKKTASASAEGVKTAAKQAAGKTVKQTAAKAVVKSTPASELLSGVSTTTKSTVTYAKKTAGNSASVASNTKPLFKEAVFANSSKPSYGSSPTKLQKKTPVVKQSPVGKKTYHPFDPKALPSSTPVKKIDKYLAEPYKGQKLAVDETLKELGWTQKFAEAISYKHALEGGDIKSFSALYGINPNSLGGHSIKLIFNKQKAEAKAALALAKKTGAKVDEFVKVAKLPVSETQLLNKYLMEIVHGKPDKKNLEAVLAKSKPKAKLQASKPIATPVKNSTLPPTASPIMSKIADKINFYKWSDSDSIDQLPLSKITQSSFPKTLPSHKTKNFVEFAKSKSIQVGEFAHRSARRKHFKNVTMENFKKRTGDLVDSPDYAELLLAMKKANLYDPLFSASPSDLLDDFRNAWNASSTTELSTFFQMAVAQEFNLGQAAIDSLRKYADDGMMAAWRNESAMRAARKFVRAVYDETQHQLKLAGLDEIPVFRGSSANSSKVGRYLTTKQAQMSNVAPKTFSVDLNHRALSSWTTDLDTAGEFTGSYRDHSFYFGMTVPREKVFSFFNTGPSTYMEREFVLIGGPNTEATMLTYTGKAVDGTDLLRSIDSRLKKLAELDKD